MDTKPTLPSEILTAERPPFASRLLHGRLGKFGVAAVVVTSLVAPMQEWGGATPASAQTIVIGSENGPNLSGKTGDLSEPVTPILTPQGDLSKPPKNSSGELPPRSTFTPNTTATSTHDQSPPADSEMLKREEKRKNKKSKESDNSEPVPVFEPAPLPNGNVAGVTLPPRTVIVPTPEGSMKPELSAEQLAMQYAKELLDNKNVTFEKSPNDRIRRSLEHTAETGKAFLYDVDQIGNKEVTVSARLLQTILAIAEDTKVIFGSMTTSDEHSETSFHYTGDAIDIKFAKDSDYKKVFDKLYKESEVWGINELIYGGDLPNKTHTLKNGVDFDYNNETKNGHKTHIHFGVNTKEPIRPKAPESTTTTIVNTIAPRANITRPNTNAALLTIVGSNMEGVLSPAKLPPRVQTELVASPPKPSAPAESSPAIPSTSPEANNRRVIPAESQAKVDAHRPVIEQSRPLYEKLAKETGVPWQIPAAMHFREATNDPKRSMWSGQALGTANWDHGDNKGNTLEEDGRKAIQHFKDKAKQVYGIKIGNNNTFEELKKAFLAYNRGSWYKEAGMPVENSPYVMNGFDAEHMDMIWPDSWVEPDSVRGYRNVQLGAMTIVVGLGLNPR